jgi:hypothetical protein
MLPTVTQRIINKIRLAFPIPSPPAMSGVRSSCEVYDPSTLVGQPPATAVDTSHNGGEVLMDGNGTGYVTPVVESQAQLTQFFLTPQIVTVELSDPTCPALLLQNVGCLGIGR